MYRDRRRRSYERVELDAGEQKALVVSFKDGDGSAYRTIYERYSYRVECLCRRMLGNDEDAAEAAQESFLRVYQALGRFNGRYQLGAWISRITTNVCLDMIRTRQRKPSDATPLEDLELDVPETSDDDPESIVIRRAEGRRVLKVLRSLPPMHRAAIVLRDFEGLSYEEVADVLDMSVSQVKALIHRARKGFRRSWPTRVASIIFPTRWVERIRHNAPAKEQVTHTASTAPQLSDIAASGTQMAASCSGLLSTCGAFLTERAAGVVAATVISTAAAGAAVASGGAAPTPAPRDSVQVAGARVHEAEVSDRAAKISTPDASADAEPTRPEPAAPSPAAAPSPTPTTAGESTPPKPATTPSPSPSPAPVEPTGFQLDVSVDVPADRSCTCLKATEVVSETVYSDPDGISRFDQALRGTAYANGSPTYGLGLEQHGDMRAHGADLVLRSEEGTYRYSLKGSLAGRTRTEWGGWVYTYGGDYAIYSRPTMSESVPESGSYKLDITMSSKRNAVVQVRLSLTER